MHEDFEVFEHMKGFWGFFCIFFLMGSGGVYFHGRMFCF